MTESQERFLRAIAARLPAERVVEVHLFPPIRNGGQETGIAIVSVALEADAPIVDSPDEDIARPAAGELAAADAGGEACDPTEDAAGAAPRAHPAGGPPPLGSSPASAAGASPDGREPAPASASSDAATDDADSVAAALARDLPEPSEPIDAERAPAPPAGPTRHTVYTARYRYTLKGPDRGKFEVDVQAEADAPLVTIDLVVRGVQQRANEAAEPERLPGDRLRALAATAPPPGASGRAA